MSDQEKCLTNVYFFGINSDLIHRITLSLQTIENYTFTFKTGDFLDETAEDCVLIVDINSYTTIQSKLPIKYSVLFIIPQNSENLPSNIFFRSNSEQIFFPLNDFEFQIRLTRLIDFSKSTFKKENKNQNSNYLENELRKLSVGIEQSLSIVFITNPNGVIEYVNNAFVKNTGFSKEEVIGLNSNVLKSGYQSDEFYKELWNTISNGKSWVGELYNRKKDGTCYWEQALISPVFSNDNKIINFIAIKENIDTKKNLEKELLENMQRQESLTNALGDIYYERNLKTKKILWMGKFQKFINSNSTTLTTDDSIWKDHIHPEDIELINIELEHASKSGRMFEMDYRICQKDGRYLWFSDRAQIIKDSNSVPEKMIGVMKDITANKSVLDALVRSEKKFRDTLESIELASFITNRNREITFCNEYFMNMLGMKSIDCLGKDYIEVFIPPEKRTEEKHTFQEIIDSNNIVQSKKESEVIASVGERKLVAWTNTALFNEDGILMSLTSIGIDITEHRRLETEKTIMNHISREFLSEKKDFDLYKSVTEIIAKHLNYEMASIEFYDKHTNKMRFHGNTMMKHSEIFEVPVSETISGEVISHGHTIIESNAKENPNYKSSILRELGTTSLICVPIRLRNKIIGALSIADKGKKPNIRNDSITFMSIADYLVKELERRESEKALMRSEKKFKQVLDTSLDLIYRRNFRTNRYEYISPNIMDFTGLTIDEFLSMPADRIVERIHPDQRHKSEEMFQLDTSKLNYPYSTEHQFLHQDGSYRWFQDLFSFIQDEETGDYFCIGSIREVTKQKELETLLIQEKKKAEEANRAKSNFLSNMSHEIRTPLNGIIGFTDLLLESEKDKDKLEMLEIMKNSSNLLLNLINDILNLSKIESGKVRLENSEFSLNRILSLIYSSFRIMAMKKGIQFSILYPAQYPDLLIGDIYKLEQILLNIISNAIKFTEKGTVTLSFFCEKIKQDSINLILKIKDTGIGISKENQEIIFDRFTQAENYLTKKYSGTGLGLSIVKELVDIMQGSISLISNLGEGSEFTLTLPFKKLILPERIEVEQKNEKGSQKKAKILLAEDNEVNQMLVKRIIEKNGWEIDISDNGKTAMEMAEKQVYDLILMDIQMPEMNGLEASSEIRKKDNPCRDVPILGLTAFTLKEEIAAAKLAGMNDLITKPFRKENLIDIIEKWLR